MSDIAEKHIFKRSKLGKLQRHLVYKIGQAVREYNMIEENDHVMVCISGGKDSFVLLDLLMAYRHVSPITFEIHAVCMDQKFPGFPEKLLPEYFLNLDIRFHMFQQDTYSVLKEKIPEGKTMCGLCSRLRRGALYKFAEENSMTKIALGHHMDDIVSTLFLNMFYGGKMKGMPPKLLTDNKKNIVIRPMACIREHETQKYSDMKDFPIIPGNLCGTPENQQRKVISAMLEEWTRRYPGRVEKIFSSMKDIEPSQMADLKLFDFGLLKVEL